MNTLEIKSNKILRLGGAAGIFIGLFILSFVIIGTSIGGLFPNEMLINGQVDPWIQRVINNPETAQLAMALPILGFSFVLIFGLVLFKEIAENIWQKYLALGGYLIGVPITVFSFISATSLIRGIIQLSKNAAINSDQINLLASFEMEKFMLINIVIGPIFIILIGNSFISFASLRSGTLPKWLCYWGIINGALSFIGFFSVIFPALGFAQISGPLTMLWYISTGVTLIRKSRIKNI